MFCCQKKRTELSFTCKKLVAKIINESCKRLQWKICSLKMPNKTLRKWSAKDRHKYFFTESKTTGMNVQRLNRYIFK